MSERPEASSLMLLGEPLLCLGDRRFNIPGPDSASFEIRQPLIQALFDVLLFQRDLDRLLLQNESFVRVGVFKVKRQAAGSVEGLAEFRRQWKRLYIHDVQVYPRGRRPPNFADWA